MIIWPGPQPASTNRKRGTPVPGYSRPAGSVWIEQHRDQLPNNEWVAAGAGGILANSPSLDTLLSKLQGMEFDREQATIAFNTEDAVV